MSDESPLAVTVIGGYLGAGKTTLVNHLLRHANGQRLAVLVNEFGELPIDADLIEADDGDLLSLSGGCICCSYGSDLMDALLKLAERRDDFDGMIIEASGVALPGGIVGALSLVPDYRMDAMLVLADAETIVERGRDRYLADTIKRQLGEADLVVLNKTDLVSADELGKVVSWLHSAAPGAEVVRTERSRLPPAVVLSPRDREADEPDPHHTHDHNHVETDGFTSVFHTPAMPLDPEEVGRALAHGGLGVVRAKGFVRRSDGQIHTVQVVGQRYETGPAPTGAKPGLVVIGVRDELDVEAVGQVLESNAH